MKNPPQKATPTIEPLSFSEELAKAVLNSLSAHIAIIDKNGMILETNHAWNIYSVKNGMPEDVDYRGINYLEICNAATGEDASDAHDIAEGIRQVIQGRTKEFLFDYPCHSADILNISETTVNFHQKNLRKKFGLKNRQMNLRSYLISMS